MMVTRPRAVVLAALLGLAMLLGTGTAAALQAPAEWQAAAPVAAEPFVARGPALTQDSTPEPGPTLDPDGSEQANAEKTKNKLIVGGIAAVLLVIVLWGRKVRKKPGKNGK